MNTPRSFRGIRPVRYLECTTCSALIADLPESIRRHRDWHERNKPKPPVYEQWLSEEAALFFICWVALWWGWSKWKVYLVFAAMPPTYSLNVAGKVL